MCVSVRRPFDENLSPATSLNNKDEMVLQTKLKSLKKQIWMGVVVNNWETSLANRHPLSRGLSKMAIDSRQNADDNEALLESEYKYISSIFFFFF